MLATTQVISAPDGTGLFVRTWKGQSPTGRTLVIVHGAGEHGGRYGHLAERFVERGWNVIAPDARGHGQSLGVPTHVESFEHYIDDLAEILRRFTSSPAQTAIFAHSMGGLVTARLLQTQSKPPVAAAVLSSPLLALQLRIPVMTRALGRVCSWLLPETRFASAIKAEQLTRSEQALLEREEDPYRHKTVTAGWYFRVLDAMWDASAAVERISIPILLQHGDRDEIANPQAALDWWCRLACSDKLFRLLAGHLHELAFEPSWSEMADFIANWLDERVPQSS